MIPSDDWYFPLVLFIFMLTLAEWKKDAVYFLLSSLMALYMGIELYFTHSYSSLYFYIFFGIFVYCFVMFLAQAIDYIDKRRSET